MGSLYIAYKMRRSISTPLEIHRKQRYKKLILNKTARYVVEVSNAAL
jgi:hypothetical protein